MCLQSRISAYTKSNRGCTPLDTGLEPNSSIIGHQLQSERLKMNMKMLNDQRRGQFSAVRAVQCREDPNSEATHTVVKCVLPEKPAKIMGTEETKFLLLIQPSLALYGSTGLSRYLKNPFLQIQRSPQNSNLVTLLATTIRNEEPPGISHRHLDQEPHNTDPKISKSTFKGEPRS